MQLKSYTDLEQSKKLAEILPLESADMFYDGVQDLYKEKTYNIPIDGSSITVRTRHIITEKGIKANLLLPAWSLAALLSVLPIIRKGKNTANPFIAKTPDNEYYVVYATLTEEVDSSAIYDNPVDACVEIIERLHELNLL